MPNEDNTPTEAEAPEPQIPGPLLYAYTTWNEDGKVHRVQVMNGELSDTTRCGKAFDHCITNEQAEVLDDEDVCSKCSPE